MATQRQLRRGTTAQMAAFTGAVGELTIDTDRKAPVVHDGSTAGGFPVAKLAEALLKAGDTLTGALNWAAAVTVASAGTTADIGAAASNLVILSGTVTITAFPSAAAGVAKWVKHTGAHLLTHNATNLILLGGANITTAAGAISFFVSEGSGNWRQYCYQRADGKAIIAPTSSDISDSTSTGRSLLTAANAAAALTVLDAVLHSNLPQNSKSAAYTTVAADANSHIFHPDADTTARTWTIDSNANVPYAIGTTITFVNGHGAGVLTIAITSDTMRLSPAGTTGSRTLAADGMATAIKVGTTEWKISGSGLT